MTPSPSDRIRELRAYLERFDRFRPGPLVIAEAASASV